MIKKLQLFLLILLCLLPKIFYAMSYWPTLEELDELSLLEEHEDWKMRQDMHYANERQKDTLLHQITEQHEKQMKDVELQYKNNPEELKKTQAFLLSNYEKMKKWTQEGMKQLGKGNNN